MKHIELFAGCGGLSLGFKNEGFDLILANEISPMASETFAYNHLKEDLRNELGVDSSTLWLRSNHPRSNMVQRLRENPFDIDATSIYSDIEGADPVTLRGKLLVGSIIELNDVISSCDALRDSLSTCFGEGEIDVISGGPPCQSFSMAGLRDQHSHRNQLPWEFAKFVEHLNPKLALLENVTGILRAFTQGGEKFHAWLEVSKAFAQIGYIPICLHVNAKYAGVAQNRPRYIMLALRRDIADQLLNCSDASLSKAVGIGVAFANKARSNSDVGVSDLKVFDVEKDADFYQSGIFASLKSSDEVSVSEALGDLVFSGKRQSQYVQKVNSLSDGKSVTRANITNHELRDNKPLVKSRFRLYQIMNEIAPSLSKEVSIAIKSGDPTRLSDACISALTSKELLSLGGDIIKLRSRTEVEHLLSSLHTKKQTQRALQPNKAAPAALSIPDDACIWDKDHPRTLTVREMARIQSFPDSFVFKSKVTTGGKMRKFEVPQYTQVGNAVPPLLAKQLAKTCRDILEISKH